MTENFYFEEPETINECAKLVKVLHPVLNLYLFMNKNTLDSLENILFVQPMDDDELEYLFSFIVKKGTHMPFINTGEKVSVQKYIRGIKIIAEWIFNIELKDLFQKEISMIDAEKIQKARERAEHVMYVLKQEMQDNFSELLSEALRK